MTEVIDVAERFGLAIFGHAGYAGGAAEVWVWFCFVRRGAVRCQFPRCRTLEGFMLWFVLIVKIDKVFFGLGDVGFGFCNHTVLANLGLGGQVGSANGFMNINVNVRFVDDFSV